ncbi:MAG TPA: tetratricopeptide repeat protein [Pyrinomonadaceae bacterium]|nr:tetratricopeptide repeat protein [Pyrinomonadaceae bacterium]
MKRVTVAAIAVFLFSSLVYGQAAARSAITPEMRQAANDAYQTQKWDAAAAAYERIVNAEDSNIGARYRYGLTLLNLNKLEPARANLEKAFAASPNAIFALALARAYALGGSKDKMYETLDKSLNLGGISPDSLTGENDFAAYSTEPRFIEFVHRSDLAVNPCKASPEFRQFDFWIGEWNAKNAAGLTVGTSSIQLILNQCVIFENWNTPLNSGKSFSIFDVKDKRWHQTWVDDKGTLTHYTGDLRDGKMIYISESITGGTKTLAKMTYSKLPNGDVRQFGEASSDDGKTWKPTFDFTYVRKNEK